MTQQSKFLGVDPSEKRTQNLQADAYDSLLAIAKHWKQSKCSSVRGG